MEYVRLFGRGFDWMLVILFFLLACMTMGCGRPSKLAAAEAALSSGNGPPTFDVIDQKIIQAKCVACHANFGSYSSLMASGVVVAGNPSASALYNRVLSGQMPKGGPALQDAEVLAIENWIAAGALNATVEPKPPTPGVPATPTPVPPPPPPTSAPQPTYDWLQANVFSTKCVMCHSGAGASAGYDLSSYAGVVSGGPVIAGNASASPLYQRVANNSMPLGGTPLSAEVKAAIASWINAGASPGTTPPAPTPVPTPAPPATPTFTWLNANVFKTRCVGCHNASSASGGVRLDTFTNVRREVVAGNPATSKLYEVVSKNDMPATGSPLTTVQKDTIRTWILNGALNN